VERARPQLELDVEGLRLLTYLAPGLPLALFEAVAAHLERALGVATTLSSDAGRSAPEPDGPEPFGSNRADLGFLCAPGYLWLAARRPPAVELVPAAFVFGDPRCEGRPVYFAELVVARSSSTVALAGLRGARWVYNDRCSLSGYFSVLAALRALGAEPDFFRSVRAVGSHHAALRAVESGEADCAAIDSNTLLLERRRGAARGVRVIESLGPFPVQPVVVRAGLAPARKHDIAVALLGMHESEPGRAALHRSGVRRFAPIAPADYEPERALLTCAPPAEATLAAR
jgi:ABC-type phosphate/phosphonate transport system substrate-binding protein